MRLFGNHRQHPDERLLWSRDARFVAQLARRVPDSRLIELEAGSCLVAAAADLTETVAAEVARSTHDPDYGLTTVDQSLPHPERYISAFATAVQLSGLAERIGMARSAEVLQTKLLDHFFVLRNAHQVAFQPIVDLDRWTVHEYECLFRPNMPTVQASIGAVVQAAIDTNRAAEFDEFVLEAVLGRVEGALAAGPPNGGRQLRFAVNVTPGALQDERFDARRLVDRVRSVGLAPTQLTFEVTEQQAVPDLVPLRRQVRALRRVGFGFAVDDAGAGYASFSLIAALRPSQIKVDRQIVRGIAADDAKQALVEAFVSFAQRIGARLVAEGIETRRDLAVLRRLGVGFGQGYLLGRPAPLPTRPRRIRLGDLRLEAPERRQPATAGGSAVGIVD
ncbi:MAG TPA: EAL domain-containing protein [Candidatus Binatia bacterium]|nr:EAL domain-containing protein [Candidatus Binatia bacterium]